MFQSTLNRGFAITFGNNLTVSVQFGTGNYCERRSFSYDFDGDLKQQVTSSENAEVAVWDKNDKWIQFSHDCVVGWMNANQVGHILQEVMHSIDFDGCQERINQLINLRII